MKANPLPACLALLLGGAVFATASEPSDANVATSTPEAAEPDWGLRDLPRLITPRGFFAVARTEVRDGINDARQDLRDLRAGEPKAIAQLAFTGAGLAGVDGGVVLGARLVYARVTANPAAHRPLLSEELPQKIEQAPDRSFRRGAKAVVRHGFTGDVGDAISNDLAGQAFELVPAALRSVRHVATRPFSERAATAAPSLPEEQS